MPQETTPPAGLPEKLGTSNIVSPTEQTPTVLPRAEEGAASATKADQVAEEARQKIAKREGFWNRHIPEKETKPKEGETKEAKPATESAKGATKEPQSATAEPKGETEEPKAEPKPRKRKAQTPEVDPLQIAEATGRAIASEMAKSSQPPAKAKEPEPEPELPEEFRRDTAVFEEMARLNPKRYGNIKKELAKYAKAEDEYIAKWEQEHPGEEFDGDSDEHDDFYKKVKPEYDQSDFEGAKESLIAQRAAKQAREELNKEWESREQRRERAEQVRPEVEREMVGLMGEMIKSADPSNAALAKDWASIQTLDEKNPLLADVMVHVHNETKPVLEASLRLFRQIDQPDQNNPAHVRVFEMIAEAEQAVLRLPIKERYDDSGRLFATQEEFARMTPAERQRHWYIGENELAAVIRGRAISQTKMLYDRESKRLARYTGGSTATARTNQPPPKEVETPPPVKADTSSPSVSGRGSLPGDGQAPPKTPSNGKDWFFSKYIRP